MVIGMFSASCWKIFYGWGTEDLRRVAPGAFWSTVRESFWQGSKNSSTWKKSTDGLPLLEILLDSLAPIGRHGPQERFRLWLGTGHVRLIACWRVLILSSFWCVVRRIAYRFRYRKLMRAGCCKLGSWCKLSHVLLFFFFWDHTKGYLLLSQIIDLVQKNI